jgi:hypothetical protein
VNFCIDAEQLRKALAEIEAAEKNGFKYCLAVFFMASAGRMIYQNRAEYSDLMERAHPTNPALNWGRFQSVSRCNRFVDGELVPIESATNGEEKHG